MNRIEQVTFENLKACAAAHKELLEENRTLQAHLATATARVKWLEEGREIIDDWLFACQDDEYARACLHKWLADEPQGGGE